MMTAKQEILDKVHIKYLSKSKTAKIHEAELTVLPYGYLMQACDEAMIEYAKLKCAEQREICANEYAYESNTFDSNNYEINGKGLKNCVRESIQDAPEPEF